MRYYNLYTGRRIQLINKFAVKFEFGYLLTGLIFAGIIYLLSSLISIPFSMYKTFIIEEKYGFNRTTLKTFILDILKGYLLTIVIGSPVFIFIIWIFRNFGDKAWLYCWTGISAIQILLMFIAPAVIMPLFNKFTPIQEGELKNSIEGYAQKEKFQLNGVFTMDGSRRSTKSNAFFTGFGKYRKIVLFDTLIKNHTTDEIVAVLAHEIGHYKKRHILKFMFMAILNTGIMLFALSFFVHSPGIFEAFKMESQPVYAGILFFAFFYEPINYAISVVTNIFSRKFEYEADKFAVKTSNKKEAFITALKKLSADNLSNLTPHPVKVFLEYSHPPVLERIKTIRQDLTN